MIVPLGSDAGKMERFSKLWKDVSAFFFGGIRT